MPTIEALPSPYPFDPNMLALVIIDMQRDFVEPGGFGAALGNDVRPLKKIVPALKRLLDTFRAHHLAVIHTREGHLGDLSDCPPSKLHRGKASLKIGDPGPMGRILVRGEPGHDLISELQPLPGETVIDKPGKGSFHGTALDSILKAKGITHLLMTGVTTEVCVQTTMREANDRGYECLLVEDCTESYFPEFKRSTLEMVRAQGGIVGWTGTSAAVISALSDGPPRRSPDKMPPIDILRRITTDPEALAHLPWEPFRPGIAIFRIYSIPEGPSAALLRYQPGTKLPRHTHQGYEHILILSGSQGDENGTYRQGDLLVSKPGVSHSIRSDDGCIALGIWEKPVLFEE